MKAPVILSYKTLKKSGELNDAYLRALQDCGGELKLIDTLEEVDASIDHADGVLLPGGTDVNPFLYGEERKSHTQPPHNERDRVEMYLLERAMDKKLPVLGICRGLQVINVKLGGTLYQDVLAEMPRSIRHDWHAEGEKPLSRSFLAHPVFIEEDSQLHAILGVNTVETNSLHHQGIKELGKGLVASAHTADGLIEAVELPGYPYLVGVQWHPEELQATPIWKSFLGHFVEQCAQEARTSSATTS